MTTEPTIARMLKTGEAKILVDMRTPETTVAALGGPYPAASLYMATTWVDGHKAETQMLANALVKTLHYIATHSAADIADKMPKDYYAGARDLNVKGLAEGQAPFTPAGGTPDR